MVELSDPAQKMFDFILDYKRQFDGLSPSYRELQQGAGLTTISKVSLYLDELLFAGLILMPLKGQGRGIRVVGGRWTYEPESQNE